MSREAVILDASALLALLNDEPGGQEVAYTLPAARISSVNLSEVVAKLAEHGMPQAVIHEVLEGLGIDVVEFDRALAYRCGLLRPSTSGLGLSLGDRACIALGLAFGERILTADRRWAELELAADIDVIR